MSIRPAAVAGRFYPSDPDRLRATVRGYLDGSAVAPAPEQVMCIVAPHAGYPYSGPTAGHAFRRIAGMTPRRVMLLGPSHYFRFGGISVYDRGVWETPLGRVPVDEAFAAELVARFGSNCPEAHTPEHALEVELPFLQVALAPGFSVVPVLLGGEPGGAGTQLAEYLAESMAPGDLLVASTDLSHFLSQAEANAIDRHSLEVLLAGNPDGVRQGVCDRTCSMCGAAAVHAALLTANHRAAGSRRLWDYRTSGAATGDFARVVGYGAVSLEFPA